MGLKKADSSRVRSLLPKKERSLDPEVIESHIQKLRSFRYQMKSTLAGDNLDTPDELAQKGILADGELGMSLDHRRNGSISLTRGLSENGDGVSVGTDDLHLHLHPHPHLPEAAFDVPRDFSSAIERLNGPQIKRSVELMGQCVQVQRSAHGVLMHAIETQEALKAAIVEKVRQMGLPVSDAPGFIQGAGHAMAETLGGDDPTVALPSEVSATGGNGCVCRDHPQSSPLASSALASASGMEGTSNGGVALPPGNGDRRVTATISLPPKRDSGAPKQEHLAGINKYAGVASMLQASAQSMRHPLPSRRAAPPGSANLYSFVPTAIASANTLAPSSTNDTSTNTAEAPAAAAATSAAAAAGLAAGLSTSEAAATAAAAAAAAAAAPGAEAGAGTLGAYGGGPSRDTTGLGLGGLGLALETGDYWEAVTADLAGGLNLTDEAIDETSLRMEMKTSMDMHRLMRSRQKNQLQLHAERRQDGDGREDRGINNSTGAVSGTVDDRNGKKNAKDCSPPVAKAVSSNSNLSAASGLQEAETLTGTTAAAGVAGDTPSSSTSPSTATATGGRIFDADGNMTTSSGVTTSERPGDAPLPAPPPDGAAAACGAGTVDVPGSNSRSSAAAVGGDAGSPRNDGGTPNLMSADWNWDEDALDAQLFSFLLGA